MSINVLTLNELTQSKLNNIAENIMIGPQANIMSSLNNINRTHNLDLGVLRRLDGHLVFMIKLSLN